MSNSVYQKDHDNIMGKLTSKNEKAISIFFRARMMTYCDHQDSDACHGEYLEEWKY
ncbi:hypothetical protein [Nitrosomonas marina]|uniref:hypothetical protein n=1 Tax=Nitrosomonas marina TaxID=917 RepID=UPI0015A57272|nr:hypothetical protein [Nitrosomonas marina]